MESPRDAPRSSFLKFTLFHLLRRGGSLERRAKGRSELPSFPATRAGFLCNFFFLPKKEKRSKKEEEKVDLSSLSLLLLGKKNAKMLSSSSRHPSPCSGAPGAAPRTTTPWRTPRTLPLPLDALLAAASVAAGLALFCAFSFKGMRAYDETARHMRYSEDPVLRALLLAHKVGAWWTSRSLSLRGAFRIAIEGGATREARTKAGHCHALAAKLLSRSLARSSAMVSPLLSSAPFLRRRAFLFSIRALERRERDVLLPSA